jgi:NADPH:quinone reductase-like Zn-dependent oxidoreductase
VKENGSFTSMPNNYNFEEAAAVCDGLMLGINIIRTIDFSKQKKILINGASGSIGTACVQLAKYYGAEVTAVCNTKSSPIVSSLGAQKIIDYTCEDFTKCGQLFDVVIDAVGKSSFNKCKPILKPNGLYLSTELGDSMENVYLPLITKIKGGQHVKFPIPTDNKQDTIYFKKIIEDGKYKAIIDRIYPLNEIIEATKYVETGEKIGNVVITM